jgi:hypothetical protein
LHIPPEYEAEVATTCVLRGDLCVVQVRTSTDADGISSLKTLVFNCRSCMPMQSIVREMMLPLVPIVLSDLGEQQDGSAFELLYCNNVDSCLRTGGVRVLSERAPDL